MRNVSISSDAAGSGSASVLAGLSRVLGDSGRSLDSALEQLLALGCQQLGLAFGVVAKVEDQACLIRSVSSLGDQPAVIQPGQIFQVDQTYCGKTLSAGSTLAVADVASSALADHPSIKLLGYPSYIGTPIQAVGQVWGALTFAGEIDPVRGFTDQDYELIELLAATIGSEVERDLLSARLASSRRRTKRIKQETQVLMDRLPAMVWQKDWEGKIVRVNEAAATAAGTTVDQMVGWPIAEFYPDQAEAIREADQAVIESGRPKLGVIESFPQDDGALRYYQTDRMPTHDAGGQVDGVLVVSTDITALKQTEAELRSMSTRFSAFTRHSPAMTWAVDGEGRYLFVNPVFEEMMGLVSEDVVGRRPDEVLSPKAAYLLASTADQISTTDAEEGASYTVQMELPVGGRMVPFMVTRFAYTDAKGRMCVGGLGVDLSEVTRVQDELAKRNKDLKALLYVISHDLREPLRAIRNFSSLVVEREMDGLGASSQDMLGRVVRGAERLDQLLSDVLTLSRAQRAEPATGQVDCSPIVNEVVGSLQPTIDGCSAVVRVLGELPALEVDAFWLRQAVMNLVSNALKFTLPDEVPEVTIRAYEPVATVADVDEDEPGWRAVTGLVVEDRGPGVEDHQKERVFGLFQRGVSRDVPGTGAGLAIVAQVAERYGGRVWIEDREGGGARFILGF